MAINPGGYIPKLFGWYSTVQSPVFSLLRLSRNGTFLKVSGFPCTALLVIGLATGIAAQVQAFRNIPALSFTKVDEGANPLPQVSFEVAACIGPDVSEEVGL
jgi:hypothetical protein